MEDTLPVMRLKEYVEQYQRHPEGNAADQDGTPAGPDTSGLLGRLKLGSKGCGESEKRLIGSMRTRAPRLNLIST